MPSMFVSNNPPWMAQALCPEHPLRWWFPDNTQKGEDAYAEGRRICLKCPVRITCLDYAEDNDENFGMWGALTPRQRLIDKKRPSSKYRQPY